MARLGLRSGPGAEIAFHLILTGDSLHRLHVATAPPESPVWAAIHAVGLAALVLPRLVPVLGREQDAFHLLRRRC
jgi:hypothetical protein